jgi:hypothetical protein
MTSLAAKPAAAVLKRPAIFFLYVERVYDGNDEQDRIPIERYS